MSFLDNAQNVLNKAKTAIMDALPARPDKYKLNRVDAAPYLIVYHNGPKPPPSPTQFLPLRTRLDISPLSDIAMTQTHAYYEEIDSIPASAVNQTSEFGEGGHWYVVHPVIGVGVLRLSTRVLMDLREWIEVKAPNQYFQRKARHVMEFKSVRGETLGAVGRELAKREGKGRIALEEGYLGGWETVGGDGEVEGASLREEDDYEEENGRGEGEVEKKGKRGGRREAGEVGRQAAEEAETRNEYDFLE